MFGLRLLWRDWRGGELGILAVSLVMAVAIVTGISLFADRLQKGLVAESNHFLAADRVLQSPRPVAKDWLEKAASLGLKQAEVLSFQSMVYVDDAMQLASVKAVSNTYPLLGELEKSEQAFAGGYATTQGPAAGSVWLDSRLLPLLDTRIGDSIFVGEAELLITAVVVNEPDRGGSFYGFGPRVLMNIADIPATAVVQPGSRVEYRYLFAGDDVALASFAAWLKPRLQPSHSWLGLKDSQPRIAQALERAERFLLLAGALGVGLAGIAIALAARRYSERHYDYVAVMKSLGASSRQVLWIYAFNLLLLAAVATLLGCLLGWLIQQGFIGLLQEYFAIDKVPAITLRPFVIGAVTALVCLLAFALPPLINLQGISPLRVLRRDLDDTAMSHSVSWGFGAAGIALLMYWYSADLKLTLVVLLGVALTFAIVGVIAWYLLRGSKLVGMQAGSAFSLALASLRRRGLQNAVQVVIFSLSIMLLLMLSLVRSSLIEEWQVQLPEGTPNHFLVNVSEQDAGPVARLLAANDFDSQPLYPMVRGRLTEINGQAVTTLVSKDDAAASSINRELNLTWSELLPNGNELVAGQWWSPDSSTAELSIESRLAAKLSIKLGDQLGFQLGSDHLTATVSSIRELDWDTMQPNFYMVFPPGYLKHYPSTYITSFYLPDDSKTFLNTFVRSFPTITVIEMDSVIKQIRSIVMQVSSAIELVLGLIVISGLLVLVASVQASLDSRFQESAILRTLGAGRGVVLGSLVFEFALLGLLAGLLAAFSAEVSVYGLQTLVLKMRYVAHPWVWLAGPLLGAVMIGLAGYLTCRKVVNTPPMEVLRRL
jgi:putative ABC transport system permease protein